MNGRSLPREIATHGAFTLLEVILAMVLATALLATLFNALSLYMRTFEAGRAEVQQAQLARALMQQIARDLRAISIPSPQAAIVLPAATPAANPTASASTSATPTTAPSTTTSAASNPAANTPTAQPKPATAPTPQASRPNGRPTANRPSAGAPQNQAPSANAPTNNPTTPSPMATPMPTDAEPMPGSQADAKPTLASAPAGLIGNESDLKLLIRRTPAPQTAAAPPADEFALMDAEPAPESDLWSVEYLLQGADWSVDSALETPEGLARKQYLWRPSTNGATDSDAATASLEASANSTLDEFEEAEVPTEVLAGEVQQFGLRYYDGAAWVTSWDSGVRGELPRAIEITLVFPLPGQPVDPAQEEEAPAASFAEEPLGVTYRLVVPLAQTGPNAPAEPENPASSQDQTTSDPVNPSSPPVPMPPATPMSTSPMPMRRVP